MSNYMMVGFADELEKTAKYPISRLLTSREAAGGLGYASSRLMGLGRLPSLQMGVKDVILQNIVRSVGGKGTLGRLRRGGKGLTQREKSRLAESIGVSDRRMDKVIKEMSRPGGDTKPISRALSSRLNLASPGNVLSREIGPRAFAGRAIKWKELPRKQRRALESLLPGGEEELLKALRKGNRDLALKQVGRGGGVAALGAGAASALGSKKGDKKITKAAGLMDTVNAKADTMTFDASNQMAKQTAKRYVRGAMRKAGLNPDSKEDRIKAGLAAGGGVMGAMALKDARSKARRAKEMKTLIKQREAVTAAARPTAGRLLRKVLSRGRG